MSVRFLPLRAAALLLLAMPALAAAQIRTVDPSSPEVAAAARGGTMSAPAEERPAYEQGDDRVPEAQAEPARRPMSAAPTGSAGAGEARTGLPTDSTFKDEEVFGAAERVFGKGAQGLAKIVEDVLKKQGRPTAYIAGREGGGAIAIGLRYGQGDLFHKVEGQQRIFWTGPSLGFDIGGNGSKTFVLVYNLHDSEDMFERFPLVEGNLYAIGGFTASYLKRGDVVLVPIRLGVGWRFGASVGYMRFSKKGRVLPF